MKYIFEFIIGTIVFFFLWNTLKRIFFTTFYKFPKNENERNENMEKPKKNLDSKLNWDAEEADYEEIKEKMK